MRLTATGNMTEGGGHQIITKLGSHMAELSPMISSGSLPILSVMHALRPGGGGGYHESKQLFSSENSIAALLSWQQESIQPQESHPEAYLD